VSIAKASGVSVSFALSPGMIFGQLKLPLSRRLVFVSRLNISPIFSGIDVIEIVYDIYAISNSGPPRDAYDPSFDLTDAKRYPANSRDDSDSQFGQKLSGNVFRREVNVRPDQSFWALLRDLPPEN
jgi:hypothetical protein